MIAPLLSPQVCMISGQTNTDKCTLQLVLLFFVVGFGWRSTKQPFIYANNCIEVFAEKFKLLFYESNTQKRHSLKYKSLN